MSALFILLAWTAIIAGLIGLVKQNIRWLPIRSRGTAAIVIAFGLTACVAGTNSVPASPEAGRPVQQAAQEQHVDTEDGEIDSSDPQAGESSDDTTGSASGEADVNTRNDEQSATSGDEQESAEAERLTKATVVNVVDGDTIDVKYVAGAELPATRIRMIGVDTPEVHGRTEPYGAEASAFTKEQLTGKTVWLEKDVSDTDRYGRALRYVWLTEPPAEPTENEVRQHMFNAILVLQGYAQASTYPPDVKYSDLFAQLQREAREAARGLWALESEQSGETEDSTSETAGSGQEGNQGQNCHPSYPDVCIPPPPPDLDCGDIPYRNFRVLPPDPHRFDGRDQDGVGCEN